MLEWTICYWRHRKWLWSPGSVDKCSLSLIRFLRQEEYSFWNVNACNFVDRRVLKESYAFTLSTNLCILKMAAPPSSKRQTRHYNQEDCRLRIYRLKRSISHAYLRHKNIFVEIECIAFIRFSAMCLLFRWYRGLFPGLRAAGKWSSPLRFHLMPKLRMNDYIWRVFVRASS